MLWVIATLLLCAVIGFVGWRIMAGSIKKPVRTATAQYQTISKDITFTGTVSALRSSSLAFELGGSIQELSVDVGDTVVQGQELARLNSEILVLELAKATADKESATAVQYTSWQKAVEDAKNTKAENARILEESRQTVRNAKKALDQSEEVYNSKVGESGEDASATQATYSTIVANQNAYKAAQKALDTAVITIKKSNAALQKTVDIAYVQYITTIQASPTNTGLSSQEALEQLARVKLAKSVLRAPFSGVITKRSVEIGEYASTGQEVFTIETVSDLKLLADVPETDALSLASGMSADVTFDALPSQEKIPSTTTRIDPAAGMIQGVPTFRVTLLLEHPSATLKPGLTSNVIVHVAKREHALGIPRRAIITRNGEEYVKIQKPNKDEEERTITTGLVGSDGTVEIMSGLTEGDVVITP